MDTSSPVREQSIKRRVEIMYVTNNIQFNMIHPVVLYQYIIIKVRQ